MFEDGILQILPPRGLDQSILLAVLVGMGFLVFLTEAFGWVFVGLVVPGYLASVAIIQPVSALAVGFESIITYLLVRIISEWIARIQVWSPFFGRERFLLIVLISVAVRQNSQIWLLPGILRWTDAEFGTEFYTDLDFYSIGLVLIPLTANMFWKLGLVRGLLQVAVPTSATYALLALVLLPYTNLSFANLALTYENVALDFLGSPKAYIILLCGTFIAARYNVLYGWDYNGILVPSLMALSWFTPKAVVITLIEAMVLFAATRAFTMLPVIRTLNLEGPRKITLVFFVGFLLKYIGGWTLYLRWPDLAVTDFFGFGYVLTSLIAVKMLNYRKIGRVLLPTAQVSFFAFIVGSLIGYTLEELAPKPKPDAEIRERRYTVTRMLLGEPLGAAAVAQARVRNAATESLREGRSSRVLRDYAALWRRIDRWLVGDGKLSDLQARARSLGLSLRPLKRGFQGGGRAYALIEWEERLALQTGWDSAILFPGAKGPYIAVPAPLRDAPIALAAVPICRAISCRGILVSGLDADDSTSANALIHPRATMRVAYRQLRSASVIQLRSDGFAPREQPVLHLKHTLPADVDLRRLWPEEVQLTWDMPPEGETSWRDDRAPSVLRIHPVSVWQQLQLEGADVAVEAGVDIERFAGRFVEASDDFLDPQSRRLVLPSETELRFIEKLVADTLLRGRAELRPWIARLAELVAYRLTYLPDCVGPRTTGIDATEADDVKPDEAESATGCLVLAQRQTSTEYPLGLLVVRTGEVDPIAVQVPRPQRESGTFRMATELWRAARGAILLINPDEKLIGPGMRLDPTSIGNPVTPFQALHQAIHRALFVEFAGHNGDTVASEDSSATVRKDNALIVQVRGFAGWRPVEQDLIIGLGPPVMQERQIPARLQAMLTPEGPLGWLADSMRYADGAGEFTSLSGQGTPQISFSRSFGEVDSALIWLSESVRERYRPASRSRYEEQFRRARLTFSDGNLAQIMAAPDREQSAATQTRRARPARIQGDKVRERGMELIALAQRYAATGDIHLLRALARAMRTDTRVRIDGLWSEQIGLPVMRIQVSRRNQAFRAFVVIHPLAEKTCSSLSAHELGAYGQRAARFLRRCGVLVWQGLPTP